MIVLEKGALKKTAEPWIWVGLALTLLNLFAAELLRPITGLRGQIDYLNTLGSIGVMCTVGLGFLFAYIVGLAIQRADEPLAHIRFQLTGCRVGHFLALSVLVSVNLAVLGEVKSQLDGLVPFAADAALAHFDILIFGTDGWRALSFLHHSNVDSIYHAAWISCLAFTLAYVGLLCSRSRRTILLSTYFMLWTVGPIIHLAMPAAGPLFYSRVGLGDHFAAIPIAEHTALVRDYLWIGFTNRSINFAGGISAMPSLHVATVVWTAIALWRTRWFVPAVFFVIYIFAASILTGWHYASDGLVAIAMTLVCYFFCGAVVQTMRVAPSVTEKTEPEVLRID